FDRGASPAVASAVQRDRWGWRALSEPDRARCEAEPQPHAAPQRRAYRLGSVPGRSRGRPRRASLRTLLSGAGDSLLRADRRRIGRFEGRNRRTAARRIPQLAVNSTRFFYRMVMAAFAQEVARRRSTDA